MACHVSRMVHLLLLLVSLLQLSIDVVVGDEELFDPLVVDEHAIQNVSSTNTDYVSFVKFVAVGPPASAPDAVPQSLHFDIPRRVFVDYVDYQDAGDLVNSSTLILLKVSSDSFGVIDRLYATSFTWSAETGAGLYVRMNDSEQYEDVSMVGHLLVEVSLFRRDQIRTIDAASLVMTASSLEIVVNDGVVLSRDETPQFSTDSSGNLDYASPLTGSSGFNYDDMLTIYAREATTLYLLSTSTPLNLYVLDALVSDSSSLYIEGTSLVVAYQFYVSMNGEAAEKSFIAFFESLEAENIDLSTGGIGTLCLAVSDSFHTGGANTVENVQDISFPLETGGIDVTGTFTCGKAQIPDRVPRDISLLSASFTPLVSASSASGSGLIQPGSSGTAGQVDAAGSASSTSSSDDRRRSVDVLFAGVVVAMILAVVLAMGPMQ